MASPLHGQQVLVLGLGESGLAMARWCARQGATVSLWDSRETPPQLGELREALPQATVRSGGLTAEALQGVQRVLKSPGLSPRDARVAPLLQGAHEQGVPVQGELDLFV
ncbi:MAG TPA: UDP-N-acetylmuramoyl-L-alanine--D-glutamate ligase, partial [Burkholderiaceae bacterium]|nr:UDP-N-acetylmuramoyl-L-alanine--D-glutamate ligase [Burkholderiaceae bacterium]